jgi:hypothetical protein
MVPSHRACGFRRRRCSLSGIWMGLVLDESLLATRGVIKDKVMAGGTPANPAGLALRVFYAEPEHCFKVVG